MIIKLSSIRELELEISNISHRINYLQGVLYSTIKKSIRNDILEEIKDLESKQKYISKELLRRY